MRQHTRKVIAVLAVVSMVAMVVFASAMPVAAQAQGPIMSKWAKVIPKIDGIFGPAEWNDAARVDLQAVDPKNPLEAYLYFKNDGDNIYMLVDFVGDTTQGASGACFVFQQLTGSQGPWEVVDGFGASPNSAVPHVIIEVRLEKTPGVFEFRPGERLNFGMGVADFDTNQWDQFPKPLDLFECVPDGAVILARLYQPIPSVSLWGTVALAIALGVLVIWHVRRRPTESDL